MLVCLRVFKKIKMFKKKLSLSVSILAVFVILLVALLGNSSNLQGYLKFDRFRKIPNLTETVRPNFGRDTIIDLEKPQFDCRHLTEFTISDVTTNDYDIVLNDEQQPTDNVGVSKCGVMAIVPRGYEELGKAYVNDILTCLPKLSGLVGFEHPIDPILVKSYIANDDRNRGYASGGRLFYKRTPENIAFDLQDVLTNNPDGFLYESGINYCANTHELMHTFFNAPGRALYVPRGYNEGTSEYAQKLFQGNVKANTICLADGVYTQDLWFEADGEYRLFAYSDLALPIPEEFGQGPLWYKTARCMIQDLDESYGRSKLRAAYVLYNQIATSDAGVLDLSREVTTRIGIERYGDAYTEAMFITGVLLPIYGDRVFDVIEKYGYTRERFMLSN